MMVHSMFCYSWCGHEDIDDYLRGGTEITEWSTDGMTENDLLAWTGNVDLIILCYALFTYVVYTTVLFRVKNRAMLLKMRQKCFI